jgi:hypothetical protein
MPRKVIANCGAMPADSAVQVEVMLRLGPPRRERSAETRLGPSTDGRPHLPRLTRLMALAIKFQGMVDRGEVEDYADLAELGYVTRARITHIMNLLHLAPNIQEEILTRKAYSPRIFERQLRLVTSQVLWRQQRLLWHSMSPPPSISTSATASEIHSE